MNGDFSFSVCKQDEVSRAIDGPFDVVWHRRIGTPTPSEDCHQSDVSFITREATAYLRNIIPYLGTSHTRWVNHPDAARNADRKALQLTLATQVGFSVPDTVITNDYRRVLDFFRKNDGRVIYKAFNPAIWMSGASDAPHVAALSTTRLTQDHFRSPRSFEKTPGIFQRAIEKQFEVRATVMGDEVVSAAIRGSRTDLVDWRQELMFGSASLVRFDLPAVVQRQCIELCRRLNLSFGAIDLICDVEGKFVFLEVNEAGQFLWKEQKEPACRMLSTFCRFLIGASIADRSALDQASMLRFGDFLQTATARETLQRNSDYQARVATTSASTTYNE